jgi:hypothetical protein
MILNKTFCVSFGKPNIGTTAIGSLRSVNYQHRMRLLWYAPEGHILSLMLDGPLLKGRRSSPRRHSFMALTLWQ